MKFKLLLLTSLFSGYAFCQYPLGQGQIQLNAGLGISGWGRPVYVGLDYGIHKDMSLGAEFSFRKFRDKWSGFYFDHRVIGIAANWNYHFNSVLGMAEEPWDIYAGINAGYYIWSSDNGYYGNYANGVGFGAQLGARYYFNDKIAINLEGGGGNAFSGGKLGLTVKF